MRKPGRDRLTRDVQPTMIDKFSDVLVVLAQGPNERLSHSVRALTEGDPSRSLWFPAGRYMLRMLTARAATSPTVRNDAIDSTSIRLLMRTLSGMASVGLNALAFVNETYR
jgi:hypothetical protein